MITIVKGDSKLVVSMHTFEEQFKNLGYQIASNEKEATKEVASVVNKEDKQEKTIQDIKENNKEEEKEISKKYGIKSKKGK